MEQPSLAAPEKEQWMAQALGSILATPTFLQAG